MPLLFFLFALLVAPSSAWAQCENPRKATDSLFEWTRPGSFDLAKASACMDIAPGANREQLAIQLKQVLDARGLWVPVPSIPNKPDFLDDDGEARVVPMPDDFPTLALERADDGRWLYSRHTMDAVPGLYASTFSPVSQWFQSALPPVFYTRIAGLYLWQMLYAFVLVVVAFVIGTVARILLRNQVLRAVKRMGLRLDDQEYARTNGPIVLLVIFGVLYWGITDLQLGIGFSAVMHGVLNVAMVLCGLFLASRFVNVGSRVAQAWAAGTENRLDDQLIPLVRQSVQVVVLVLGVLYLADAIGIDVWKLAAGVGIGGLAFALAAQDTVANVFGSVNIFVDRPFQIGDWVIIGSVEGVVEEVGFRSTRVRTFYNSVVTIPNSQITNANVDNMGLRPRRRVKMMLSLTYDTPPDKLEAYVEGVRAILAAHPFVQRTYEVHVYTLGASSVDILVYYHVVVPGWHEELKARSQNILEFMRLAEQLGVSFAFPSTSVYLESTPSEPLRPHSPRSLEELGHIADSFGPNGSLARPEGPRFARSWSVQARAEADHGSVGSGAQQ
ncbi:MAG: mechanosensitive ion channel family protein [Alphaproteobacteria bacterium]|nr:mechanosensitive ion channel family protein [Alphaproteobacteria bacterium]